MNRIILINTIYFISAFLITGCSKTLDYNWVISNSGKTKITNAYISYPKFKSVGGNIIPKSTATHMVTNRKIPKSVTIKWNTISGKEYVKNIKITDKIIKNIKPESYLVFEINNKNEVLFYVKPPFKY